MTISWSDYDENSKNFKYSPGTLDETSSTHISTLTIIDEAVLVDVTFTCSVSSPNHLASPPHHLHAPQF